MNKFKAVAIAVVMVVASVLVPLTGFWTISRVLERATSMVAAMTVIIVSSVVTGVGYTALLPLFMWMANRWIIPVVREK